MDFQFTPEEQRFRGEVRGFINQELPPDWEEVGEGPETSDEDWALHQRMARKLGEKGWLALAWPREYGGQGRSPVEQLIFKEEMAYRGAPGVDQFGVGMLGPTLMVYGTEEQKREHLGRIARGEVLWCEGYSEPNSGSDLASLQTRAVEDGDDFVVNGQKIWTTGGHRADWIFFLARTDPQAPKHKGISFLLADMKTPGVAVRNLENAANLKSFNEVYFDEFRVPRRNLVGEVNQGWYVAANLLNFERSGVAFPARGRRLLEYLVGYAGEATHNGQPLARNPLIRRKLADIAVEVEVSRMLSYRIAWQQAQGLIPQYEASAGKVFGSEMLQHLAQAAMQLLGLYGQLEPTSKCAPIQGMFQVIYITCLGGTIAAGTSEIMRNIIAQRGLGLPR